MLWDTERQQRELDAKLAREELDRIERREERQAFLTAIQAMVQVSIEASKASAAQAAAFQTFLDGFRVTGAPTSRVLTEEEDYKRFMDARDAANAAAALNEYKNILDDPFAD